MVRYLRQGLQAEAIAEVDASVRTTVEGIRTDIAKRGTVQSISLGISIVLLPMEGDTPSYIAEVL
jgi:hypothetical protein